MKQSHSAQGRTLPWRTHSLVALGLALFVLLLFYRLLFTNQVLASGDILLYFYPYREYAASALRAGRIPLWNPYSFLGVPFLANPQAAVLYPLHWPLSWLPVTKQIYWSAAMHAWLLGFGGYLLMRRWHYSAWAGLITGLTLAGSGFYGGLIGHINQMNVAAWLPWSIWVYDLSVTSGFREGAGGGGSFWRRRSFYGQIVWLSAIVALMLLAGHTQTAYINLFGLGVWAVALPLVYHFIEPVSQLDQPPAASRKTGPSWRGNFPLWWALGERLSLYCISVLLGVWMAAAQLLPTLELSNLGLRSGGLSYAEVTSFSLQPLKLWWTLLPSYGLVDLGVIFSTLGYTEFVAYVGFCGLLLACIGVWKGARVGGGIGGSFGLLFVLLGLFLATGRWNPFYYLLYKLVPGFDLFRTPARWMMLYTLGMAVLAGAGFERVRTWSSQRRASISTLWSRKGLGRALALSLVLLTALDLLLAAAALPHTQPTAPQAVTDVRTGPAHLLTDPVRGQLGPAAMGRFLSLSNTRFDPGDMADLQRLFMDERLADEPNSENRAALDPRAFDQLIVALKEQEILAPNLALLWRVPSVDGFDGGVLPLQRYIQALSLFVPPEQVVPDGRLREQIERIPSANLLNFLNVQYVITDKVRDLWFEDVYYDRQIGATLRATQPSTVIDVPQAFEATRLDLIGYLSAEAPAFQSFPTHLPAANVAVIQGADVQTFSLLAGAQLADEPLDSVLATRSGAQVAYQDVEGGHQEYIARFAFDEPISPERIELRLDDEFQQAHGTIGVVIQAATLVDTRTGTFVPLLPSDRGHFARVHSGDVKIYENRDVFPRAYLVHQVVSAEDDGAALARVQHAVDQLKQLAIVEGLAPFTSTAHVDDSAQIVSYAPERVEVRTRAQAAAFLVLSDSNYPGWRARVDGEAVPIYAANYLLRGVALPAGEHTVVFDYAPASWQRGMWLSMAGIVVWLLLLGVKFAN